MQKSDIITLPNQQLRTRSRKVGLIDPSIASLINGMESATLDWEDSREHEVGVALAAIQVANPLRLVIIRNDFDNKSNRTFSVFINPIITKYEGELVEDYEGCLSVPDIYGKVPRYHKVKISATNELGERVRINAEGFLARVFQHEIDHTNGIVFIDHIKDNAEAFYKLDHDGRLKELNYDTDIRTNSLLW